MQWSCPLLKDLVAKEIDNMLLIWVQENLRTVLRKEWKKLYTAHKIWSVCINLGYLLSMKHSEAPSSRIALETQTDAEASTFCAIAGFYKHANSVLRGWLETTFLGVWFDFDPSSFQDWLDGKGPFKDRGFFRKRWLTELLNKTPFRDYERENNLSSEALDLYKELSKSTHAMGEKYQESVHRDDTIPKYRTKHFDGWFRNLFKVFELKSTVLILKYPRLFKTKGEESASILALLPRKRLAELNKYVSMSCA